MFFHRESLGRAEVVFTDASTDLGREDDAAALAVRERLGAELSAGRVATMRQVHGADVVEVGPADTGTPTADALTTGAPGVALLVRYADCTPVVLVDEAAALAGVVHAGREGLVRGVVPAAVAALVEQGAADLHAWVGPRACGRCYELPPDMADAVEAAVPGTRSTTSWGTAAVDVGAGVVAQLTDLGVAVHDVGADACTIEDERLWSHRRAGAAAGRMGAAVVLR